MTVRRFVQLLAIVFALGCENGPWVEPTFVHHCETEEQDFAAWHGEDYMYQVPDGRRYLTDADEPANAVDVTDVPLQYEDELKP